MLDLYSNNTRRSHRGEGRTGTVSSEYLSYLWNPYHYLHQQRVSRPKQRVSRPKQRVSRPKQRVSTPKQRVSRSKQRVSIPKQRPP
jgi:hypothetical protein